MAPTSPLPAILQQRPDLIFDLGLHEGQDTAFYLHRGFNVVAVDANPDMIQKARERFASEIASGRLTLVNLGIGSEPGEMTFWVSSKTDWSSFDKRAATRLGQTAHPLIVRLETAASLFQEYGVPHYLKIDIEGADEACLDSVRPGCTPQYISWEWGDSTEDLSRRLNMLEALSYTRFKIIRQNDHSAKFLPSTEWRYRLGRTRRRLSRRFSELVGRKPWHFVYGSSGPFGEETDGRWKTSTEILTAWDAYYLISKGDKEGPWFDIHAKLG